MAKRDDAEFEAFLDAVSPRLLQTAWLLTGHRATAEDLVQSALERVYVAWPRLERAGAPAYARRVLVNLQTDQLRRRRGEYVTAAVPEIVEAVRRYPGRELILDGEVLSFDRSGRPQPFQATMRRFGRKLDVERVRADLPLTPLWFDLLYLNGGSLVDQRQRQRFAELAAATPPESLIPHLVTADPEAAETFVRQAIAAGHEGAHLADGGDAHRAVSLGAGTANRRMAPSAVVAASR